MPEIAVAVLGAFKDYPLIQGALAVVIVLGCLLWMKRTDAKKAAEASLPPVAPGSLVDPSYSFQGPTAMLEHCRSMSHRLARIEEHASDAVSEIREQTEILRLIQRRQARVAQGEEGPGSK